ncbi:LysM peptidoglycan-binding domain-containing protein [Oceanobacillus piezotolerans]|uniref:LysM peptidoglycan-binding domain-containing protein n=1 Tax=Oceanobacillus piezotolerans TaxID=2448030 RepID=A0A498DDW3_9BACI|nr:M14 family metallopeptidase [Oceanobacillus piezotolerans]RLL48256.1 LysM peptidoglycan-binding domain-containing protein [Oceanobacillus piezotolerans]
MEVQVRPGDSLWYYSQLFGISLTLIEASNPQATNNQLSVGDIIRIPGYQIRDYIIKENDTLWTIAMANNIPLDTIQLLNQSANPAYLQVGQIILLPERVTTMIVNDISNYTYEKMREDLNQLLSIYPFITSGSIGSSVLGKEIIEVQIGIGTREIHTNGSFHANEWITTPVILRFLNEYAMSLTNNVPIRGLFMFPLFNRTRLSLVPMVNPDGVNLVINGANAAGELREQVLRINNQSEDFTDWKANINGVDLNNQFPALWEIERDRKPNTPQPRDYPGPYPLSEPEAIAMADLQYSRKIEIMNALHTQGKVIFWGFEGFEPSISETIVNEYARVSGYTPIQYTDSYAGYKDWFIQEFRRPGFTVELGSGVNPLPIEDFEEIYQQTLGILIASLYV